MATKGNGSIYSLPKLVDGQIHRGVISIEDPPSLLPLIHREYWVILCCQHYPTAPPNHPAVDIHQVDRMYDDACAGTPYVNAIPREFIDENIYRPLPDVEKKYDVLFNATWWLVKRQNLLIDAIKYAKAVGKPFSVLWYGYHWRPDGIKLEESIKGVVASNQLPVTFAETCWDAEENNRRYNSCRMAIICSTHESGPRVMSEAMLANIPYLTTRDTYGGSPSYMNGVNGLVFDPHPEALCDAVWSVLANPNKFMPRLWALDNMCKTVGISRTREALARLEVKNGWTINKDIDYDGNTRGGWPEEVGNADAEFHAMVEA